MTLTAYINTFILLRMFIRSKRLDDGGVALFILRHRAWLKYFAFILIVSPLTGCLNLVARRVCDRLPYHAVHSFVAIGQFCAIYLCDWQLGMAMSRIFKMIIDEDDDNVVNRVFLMMPCSTMQLQVHAMMIDIEFPAAAG